LLIVRKIPRPNTGAPGRHMDGNSFCGRADAARYRTRDSVRLCTVIHSGSNFLGRAFQDMLRRAGPVGCKSQ